MYADSPRSELASSQSSLSVKSTSGALILSVGHDNDTSARFLIYSITGQMVKSVDVAAGTDVTVELPSGYYIVKTSQWSKRVIVK